MNRARTLIRQLLCVMGKSPFLFFSKQCNKYLVFVERVFREYTVVYLIFTKYSV